MVKTQSRIGLVLKYEVSLQSLEARKSLEPSQ